jgi:hypothetical protein
MGVPKRVVLHDAQDVLGGQAQGRRGAAAGLVVPWAEGCKLGGWQGLPLALLGSKGSQVTFTVCSGRQAVVLRVREVPQSW